MALVTVMRNALTARTPTQIRDLAAKLRQQGIEDSSALKVLSRNLLERELRAAGLSLGEVADVMKVWVALQKPPKNGGRAGKGASKGSWKGSNGSRNHRSRSPRRDRGCPQRRDRGGRGANNQRSSSKASWVGSSGRSSRDDEAPPLFAAIRADDVEEVRRLIASGASVEQKHQGWTPLMVASELGGGSGGYFSIALLLLEKGADVNATNRKGRCALSFAAAPSRDEAKKEQRVSALELIKLLISWEAKRDRKDDRGKTPRDYAEADSNRPLTSDPRLKRAQAAALLREDESA